ncbi:MAG: sigma-70 family RNA polymerase sigma factor [Polyangiaceae bacterium]|nr:sigma-70 family RNA polymerase sigma factor [Polyangiaceae bacterium]
MSGLEDLLPGALAGDRAAMRGFVDAVSPIIWTRVIRVAQRHGRRTPDQLRQLAEDLMQEVFAALFQDGGRALRGWVPERGLSLGGYVGLLAEHQAASILRSGRKSGWREDATEDATLETAVGASSADAARLDARDLLTRVLERVRAELSPRGLQLFELLVIEERPIEEVAATMQMSADALYAWRSRMGKLATRIAAELEGASETAAPTRIPSGDSP